MKVYGLFQKEVFMPFVHEALIDVYGDKTAAEAACAALNASNNNPMEEDSYGPLSGSRYFVATLEVK